ncbi:MAG: sigma-70 family RNA polymerase sigma factor [Bryobacteraceae bacterium]
MACTVRQSWPLDFARTVTRKQQPAPFYSEENQPDQQAGTGTLYSRRRTEVVFDEKLLIALRDRDQTAEEYLAGTFSRPLSLKLASRLRSPQLIEDARQETFLRVLTYFRSGKTLDNPASLPAFLIGICNNVCLEFLRSHVRHEQIPVTAPDPADESLNPEQNAVTQESKQLVKTILNDLEEKDRRLLRRVFLDEADKDEICTEMGVDRDYLRVLVHRAKLRFRTVLAAAVGR